MSYNPSSITPEEYFNALVNLGDRDIGRPIEQSTKIQKFKATLWLCEDFPLSLQEQVLPIIDLMATSNAHFAKLRDFITLQLPAGFPVKIGEWSPLAPGVLSSHPHPKHCIFSLFLVVSVRVCCECVWVCVVSVCVCVCVRVHARMRACVYVYASVDVHLNRCCQDMYVCLKNLYV